MDNKTQRVINCLQEYLTILQHRPIDTDFISAMSSYDGLLLQRITSNSRQEQNQIDLKEKRDELLLINKAAELITKAEITKLQADVDSATEALNNISDVEVKSKFESKLIEIQGKINDSIAASAVDHAFESLLSDNLDTAQLIVDSLPAGSAKSDLTAKLILLRNSVIEKKAQRLAYDALLVGITTQTQTDVSAAQALIDIVTDAAIKSQMQEKLNVVINDLKKMADEKAALDSVILAEGSKLQTDIDQATTLVNALTDETFKADLLSRLGEIIVADQP